MEEYCDLEVDVNGEEVFMVHKEILISFSSLFCKLFGNLKGTTRMRNLKVIFNEFPGGAEAFELIARFCYNNGRTVITPSNILLLNCAAHFLGMDGNGSSRRSLMDQTEKSLEGINFWTWSELLEALKRCQDLLPATKSSIMLQGILDCLIGRLALPSIASSYTCSSDSSSFQFSCDTRSTDSLKNNPSQLTWWFDDLLFLNVDLIHKVIKTMVSQKFNNATIYKFLFYYHKSRCLGAAPAEKHKVTKVVINLLSLIDRSSLSCKGLFEIYRVALGSRISKVYRNKIESLMGSQLYQATIDYLLAPSPHRRSYLYDVNLVLRLVQAFLVEGSCLSSTSQLKKVANLLDSYLVEVAPDSHLKPSKFTALVLLLPDYARESYDHVYRAMDLFLEVHAGLCEEEKLSVCCALNHEKLSAEALKDLSWNSNFPSQTVQKALITQQSKIKSSLPDTCHLIPFSDSLFCSNTKENLVKEDAEQILLYNKKLDSTAETEKLRADLDGMNWKVMGLEKVCGTMQTEMANIMRSRLSILGNARFLPKLCS